MGRSHQPLDIHRKIVEFIDTGRSFALAMTLKADGSTPCKAGMKAIIDGTGRIWGTIGGGRVEAEAQHRTVDACKSKRPVVFEINLGGTCSNSDEPICGGTMRILIDPTAATNRAAYAQAVEALQRRQGGVLTTEVRISTRTEITVRWFPQEAIPSDAGFPGAEAIRLCLAREKPQLFMQRSQKPEAAPRLRGDKLAPAEAGVLVEPVIPKPLLLIIGGGHIGQALALQAKMIGFDVAVIDDRPEFTDADLFPEGVTTRCGDIASEIATFDISKDTYIVIVTHGHKLDADALEACIHTSAAYIGMIGSERKVALIRKNFIDSGVATAEEFRRVFAPIGLDIGAVTVPEISMSIAAQLIAVRRKGSDFTRPDDMVLQ